MWPLGTLIKHKAGYVAIYMGSEASKPICHWLLWCVNAAASRYEPGQLVYWQTGLQNWRKET